MTITITITQAQIKADAQRAFNWWKKQLGNGGFDELVAEYKRGEAEKGRDLCFDDAYDELAAKKLADFTKTPEQLAATIASSTHYKNIKETQQRQAESISSLRGKGHWR